MPLRERISAITDRIDERLAAAADRELRRLSLSDRALARAFNELARIRLREDPDYSVSGVAPLYALKYGTRRALSIIAAIQLMGEVSLSGTVTDVGSGTGAGSLALRELFPGVRMRVQAIEPCESMALVAKSLVRHPPQRITHHGFYLEDMVPRPASLEPASLALLSACLQYAHLGSTSVLVELAQDNVIPGGKLAIIEPQDKEEILLSAVASFENAGFRTEVYDSGSVASFLKVKRPVRRAQAVVDQLCTNQIKSQLLRDRRAFWIRDRDDAVWPLHSWVTDRTEHYCLVSP